MHRFEYFYMNTAELLDKVFAIYKKTFWLQMARAMIFGIPAYILLAIYVFAGVVLFGVASFGGDVSIGVSLAVFILLFVIGLLLWQAVSITGNFALSKQAFYGNIPTLDMMCKEIKKNFLRVFTALFAILILAVFIIGLIILAMIYIIIPVGRDINFYRDISISYGAQIAIIVGLIVLSLLAAAFIVLTFQTLTSFAVPCAIFEKKMFFSAVIRSVSVVKGDFRKIFGTYFLWFMIYLIISYSLMVIYYIATGSFTNILGLFTGHYTTGPGVFAMDYMVSIIISLVLSPFGGILTTTIYFNQLIKKVGLDIEIELGRG